MNRNGISTTQLAKICGVSQGTVDRALNNRKGINKDTKEKILAAAKEYGYRYNQGNKSDDQQYKRIGVILPNLKSQGLARLTETVRDEALKKGFSTVIMFNSANTEEELQNVLTLYHMGIKGLIFTPVNCGEDFIKFLLSLDLPILTINKMIDSIPYMGSCEEPNDSFIKEALAYITDGKPFAFESVEN